MQTLRSHLFVSEQSSLHLQTDAPYLFLNKFAGRFSVSGHAASAMVDNQNRIASLNVLFDVPGVPGVQAAAVSSANKWERIALSSSISPPRMDHTSIYYRSVGDSNTTSDEIYVFGGKCEQVSDCTVTFKT